MLTGKTHRFAVFFALALVCALAFYLRDSSGAAWLPSLPQARRQPTQKIIAAELPPSADNDCSGTWLQMLAENAANLTSSVKYTRKCIRTKPSRNAVRSAMTNIDAPLVLGSHEVDMDRCRKVEEPPCEPMDLEVPISPKPDSVDASHMIFGASTTFERLDDAIAGWERWLSGNGAQLVVIVSNSTHEGRVKAEADLNERGINATLVVADETLEPTQRHVTITEQIYQRRIIGQTEWLVIVDDDTFFPYMPALVQRLRTKYDSRKSWYIGAISEDMGEIMKYGIHGYGGAGVFMSLSLADDVHAGYEECVADDRGYGDINIGHCVYKHSKTKLTNDDQLHQHNLKGDPSGLYELGDMPLSVHHWKTWYHADVVGMHLVSEVCGECVLQRWQFSDNFILSNGYSASKYPRGIDFDTERIEATFDTEREEAPNDTEDDSPWYWSLSLRRKMSENDKFQFKLVGAEKLDGGEVRQLYVKPGRQELDGPKTTVDEVIEMIWY